MDTHLSDIRDFIIGKMGSLRELLAGDPAPDRKELFKHVSEIRMMPQQVEHGKGHYVAKGGVEATWKSAGCAKSAGIDIQGNSDGCGGLQRLEFTRSPVREVTG